MIKVLVVEGQRLFSEGICALLTAEEDITVVGTAVDGETAIEKIETTRPDIVLMDIHMPKMNGIKATTHMKRHYPTIKVILLTTFADEELVIRGFLAGGDGYLLKNLDRTRLIRSIRDVYDDQIVISGEAANILAKLILEYKYNKKDILQEKLVNRDVFVTGRELDVAFLLMQHKTNKEIANQLYLSEGTVKNYISIIYKKLNLRNRKEVIDYLNGLFSQLSQLE